MIKSPREITRLNKWRSAAWVTCVLLFLGMIWKVGLMPLSDDDDSHSNLGLDSIFPHNINQQPAPEIPGANSIPSHNSATQNHSPSNSDSPSDNAIPNEFVITFDRQEDYDRFKQRAEKLGFTIIDSLDRWKSFRIHAPDNSLLRQYQEMNRNQFKYAPNYYVYAPAPDANNPDYQHPETPARLYAFGSEGWEMLGLVDDENFRGSGVTVAILDTAMSNHLTFADTSIKVIQLLPEDLSAVSGDFGDHATAVASIIAGNIPEARGIAPEVTLLNIQVMNDEGVGDTFTLAKGIEEAINNGAHIINLSLGTYGDSAILHNAIQYALENNVILVAAAGNDGNYGITYPARYDGVIAVGAIDRQEQHPGFSNYGLQLDIVAPGVGVRAAWGDDLLVNFSGTSAATAFVSGALAAQWSKEPQLSAEEIERVLIYNTNDIGQPGWDELYGAGVLNIGRIQTYRDPGIYDVAIASHYADPQTLDQKVIHLTVAAQNRGTEIAPVLILTTTLGGDQHTFTFYDVKVGETVSVPLTLESSLLQPGSPLTLSTFVTIPNQTDIYPDNNTKTSTLTVKE